MPKNFTKIVMITVAAFLLCGGCFYLYAQEQDNSREEALQHYRQGETLFAQGHYQEANSEFDKAVEALTPERITFENQITQQTQRALSSAPASAQAVPEQKLKEKKKEEKKQGAAGAGVTTPAPAVEEEETGENREYYIDIGDVLDISVWQIADLSKPEVIVRPDGRISFPLVGDIKVEGLTLTQLGDTMTERLKKYVKAPQVSIMIRRFGEHTNKVVVLGEIPSPGVYKFSSPPSITEAVASAGGYTKYAVLNSIMIIRGDLKAKPEVLRVNLAQILKSGRLSENIRLQPNDIIYVPKSFIGNVNTFLEIFQPAVNEYMQTLNAKHLHNIIHSKSGL